MPRIKKVAIPTKKAVTVMTRRIRMRVKHFLSSEKMDMSEITVIVALVKKYLADQHLTILNGVKLLLKMFEKILTDSKLALRTRMYKKSVKKQLDEVWKMVLGKICSKDWVDARTCLDALMKLLHYEISFLVDEEEKGELKEKRLTSLYDGILSKRVKRPPVLVLFKRCSKYLDVMEYTWEYLQNYINSFNFSNEIFAGNFMALVRSCQLNEEIMADRRFLDLSLEKFDYKFTRKSIIIVWESLLKVCNLERISFNMHRQLLLALKEVFSAHLFLNPHSTTEFLLNSLALGEQTSMLSLENLYMLIRVGKVSLKDLYINLVGLLDASNFLFKPNKARILYLADLFLSSSEVPLRVIVSFVKQLGRLTLHLGLNDRIMVLTFIRILIRRFSRVEYLALTRTTLTVNQINMLQPSPILTMAFISSLWDVGDYPVTASRAEVKETACDIFITLPIHYDKLSYVLDKSDVEPFNLLIRSALRKIASCYNRSLGFRLNEFDRFHRRSFF